MTWRHRQPATCWRLRETVDCGCFFQWQQADHCLTPVHVFAAGQCMLKRHDPKFNFGHENGFPSAGVDFVRGAPGRPNAEDRY